MRLYTLGRHFNESLTGTKSMHASYGFCIQKSKSKHPNIKPFLTFRLEKTQFCEELQPVMGQKHRKWLKEVGTWLFELLNGENGPEFRRALLELAPQAPSGLAWSYKHPESSASLSHTLLSSWIERKETPLNVRAEFQKGKHNAGFMQELMKELLESGEEELARKFAELSGSSGSTTPSFERKMKRLARGESFQCPECGEFFSTTLVRWCAFLDHIKTEHPHAPKPERCDCLVDVEEDGMVKPVVALNFYYRRGGRFHRKK